MSETTNKERDNQKKFIRMTPQNELDLVMLTTEPDWGKPTINADLRDKLSRHIRTTILDDKGNVISYQIDKEGLWGLLGFYTRDMRLANLSTGHPLKPWMPNELKYCQYYLDLANDFLQEGLIKSFLVCLSRVATILELSQSKNGFLRKNFNTFREEKFSATEEPAKRSLFSGIKNSEAK